MPVVVASVAGVVWLTFDLIARASLWGIFAAAGFRVWCMGGKEANVFLFLVCMSSGVCCYGNGVPMQVFLLPLERQRLCSEPLYKVLRERVQPSLLEYVF